MHQDVRDRLEVLKFDVMEETVGSLLRAVIRHVDEKQDSLESPRAAAIESAILRPQQ
jgi:hypothetical protein